MSDQEEEGSSCLATSRSRRQKVDKSGRLAALAKFKDLKGTKRKYEIEEEFQPVYDIVDENEYSRQIQERQEDDWIVDDDGSGYVEDGRDVFDDIAGSESQSIGNKSKRGKFKKSDVSKKPVKRVNNIKSMFSSANNNQKKSDKEAKLDVDDDLLGDIMEELNSEPSRETESPIIKRRATNPFRTAEQSTTPTRAKHMKKALTPRVVDYSSQVIETVDSQASSEKKLVDQNENIEVDDSPQVCDDEDMWSEDLPESAFSEVPASMDMVKASEEKKTEPKPVSKSVNIEWSAKQECTNQGLNGNINIGSTNQWLTTGESGKKLLKFYWLDAYEDVKRQNGTVYLFGKVYIESSKHYVSCCVCVKNINRQLFILPRVNKLNNENEAVTMKDVYEEFNEKVADKYKIKPFRSKKVNKNYAFDVAGVPEQSDYLEVQYSAEFPTIPRESQGETFSHVFGTATSSLETFLMHRKMKGPCWLEIKNPEESKAGPYSWCRIEVNVNSPTQVNVLKNSGPAPPLVVMTVSMPTVVNPKTMQNEFVAVSCLVHEQFSISKGAPNPPYQMHFCALSKPADSIFPFDFSKMLQTQKVTKIEKIESERALLGFFLARIQRHDPDIIVGHDIVGFDLDVLIHRLDARKVPHWSRIGRLRRTNIPKLPPSSRMQQVERDMMCGRLICDVKISAKELIRAKSYDLTELVDQILHKQRIEIPQEKIRNMYSSSQMLMQFVQSAMLDAEYVVSILCELNILPLALQITNIAGNLFGRTLLGGRSERNEYLLLHAFYEKNYICPDKVFKSTKFKTEMDDEGLPATNKSGRKKPTYSGGLVLEPKKGFYDTYILLMDFNSLYPSIIQEYNICFTTVPQGNSNDNDEEIIPDVPDPSLEAGILPTEIRKLVESRREVKKLMKSPDISNELKMQYDIRQKALKLTANSMYGCLGFSNSRFYAKSLAALVTSKGREILLHTKDLVQSMNLDVIYGDTDSIMINTISRDLSEVFKLGHKVKAEVNKAYRCLEIDIDGVYKAMLLLKKKKYAALTVQEGPGGQLKTSKELKGLDIVRRDWSELAKEAGEYVVSEILSEKPRETIIENIQTHLINLSARIKEIPNIKFCITKQLTKDPSEYPDKKSLPHVVVANRLNSKGGKKLRRGDAVSYIICDDGSNLPATQRAYHNDELKNNPDLKLDLNYYLSQQIHPVVSRLCDPIEGADAAAIAEFLGLDPSKFRQTFKNDHEESSIGANMISEEERFRDCHNFKFNCVDCNESIEIEKAFTGKDSSLQLSLAKCKNLQCTSSPASYQKMLCNKLTLAIRKHINQYYQGWLLCEDSNCGLRTRRLPLKFTRSGPVCPQCQRTNLHQEYSDHQLYLQLCYYQNVFDVRKHIDKLNDIEKSIARRISEKYSNCYRLLKQTVDRSLQKSAYSVVNLTKLFEGFMTVQKK